MRLKFNVHAQQIFRVDRIPLASDSRLYIAATAEFDSEWDDLTARWLTFEPRTGTAITAVLADGNSFDESLGVSQAGGLDGEAPPYVPPDAAGQIAAVAAEARDIAQSVRDDADAGKFKGEEGKPGLTPHIGENGNWFYGDEDSGIPAGAAGIKTDHTLSYTNGVLSVNTANAPEADNTLPITSAAVNTVVGNIETLLNKI